MSKKQFYQQISIDDAKNVYNDDDDDHIKQFRRLLFDELLSCVKNIPFDYIIQNDLLYRDAVHKTKEANAILWLYTADRKLIHFTTIYTFRFPNICHPEFYQTFIIKYHHLFRSISQQRHNLDGWCGCINKELLNYIDRYLNIQRVIQNQNFHTTSLFINQKVERLDIEFNFEATNERITLTFEPGSPASWGI